MRFSVAKGVGADWKLQEKWTTHVEQTNRETE